MITTGPLRLTVGAANASVRIMTALCALLSALFLLAFLNGCTSSPQQRYELASTAYDGTATAIALQNQIKPYPGDTWTRIQANELSASMALAKTQQWLTDNAALANTAGAICPPLLQFDIAYGFLVAQASGIVKERPSQAPAGAAQLKP